MAASRRQAFGLFLFVAGLACGGCIHPARHDDVPDYTLDLAEEKAGPPWPSPLLPSTQPRALDAIGTARDNKPASTEVGLPTFTFDGVNLTTADQKTSRTLERSASSAVSPPAGPTDILLTERSGSGPERQRQGDSSFRETINHQAGVGSPHAEYSDKDITTLPPIVPPVAGAAVQQTAHFSQEKTEAPRPASGLRTLQLEAARRYGRLDAYVARLRRSELVGGKRRWEEIEVTFRKAPWSIHLKWLGGEGAGREVVYCAGQGGDQVHVLTGRGEALLRPLAGRRLRFGRDSAALLAWTGRPLAEADIGSLIERFNFLVDAVEHGDVQAGALKLIGQLKRPEFEAPVDAVLQTIPPAIEPALPRGGQRWWFFDRTLHLPVLVVTQDEQDHEVEYRCYDRFLLPANRLTDEEFNPDVLWARR
jgi:hypothetical protein